MSEIENSGNKNAGKYLTFMLSNEEYGLWIMNVRSIIGLIDITVVPRTPDYIRGVINLRGAIIPIVDMRLKFGMKQIADTRETTIIVVEIPKNGKQEEIGLLVDAVSEVLDIKESEIEETPAFGGDMNLEFLLGMAKTPKSIISLLNVQKILSTMEIIELKTSTEN